MAVNIASHVCFIVGDAIIVLATVFYTYRTIKVAREANIEATFSTALLRAGVYIMCIKLVCVELIR